MNNCLQRALSVGRENNLRCLMGLLLLKDVTQWCRAPPTVAMRALRGYTVD